MYDGVFSEKSSRLKVQSKIFNNISETIFIKKQLKSGSFAVMHVNTFYKRLLKKGNF